MLQSCYRQFWYLTGELVIMALVDSEVDREEKESLARVLHGTPRRTEKTGSGKPVFPVISCLLTPTPTPPALSTMVTPDSWNLFDRLGLTGDNVSLYKQVLVP